MLYPDPVANKSMPQKLQEFIAPSDMSSNFSNNSTSLLLLSAYLKT